MDQLKGAVEAAIILKSAFKRKSAGNRKYSQAALARNLSAGAASVNKILTGKNYPPKASLQKISHILELDTVEQSLFMDAILSDKMPEHYKKVKSKDQSQSTATNKIMKRSILQTSQSVFSNWFSEGDCAEVYQVNVQLFPLMKTKSESADNNQFIENRGS